MKCYPLLVLFFHCLFYLVKAQNPTTIELKLDDSIGHRINRDVYGCNNWISTRPYYLSDSSFIAKYTDLGKPTMRYPGGTPSNYLKLATGWYKTWQGANANDSNRVVSFNRGMITNGKADKGEEINKFIDFLMKTGAKSTFVLNLTLDNLSETGSMLDSISVKGAKLDYVEMGNELYYGQYSAAIPDVSDYIKIAKSKASLVRTKFPNAKIGVLVPSQIYTKENFLPGEDNSQDRQERWYQALKKESFYDGIVIHIYSDVGMDGQVKEEDFLPYQTAYLHAISHVDSKLVSTFSKLKEGFPDKEIWITEYHVGGFTGEVRNYRLRYAYLGGLYAATFLIELFSERQVTLASWHSMVQWLKFQDVGGGLLDKKYPFEHKVNYEFFKLFTKPSNNTERFVRAEFSNILGYAGTEAHSGSFKDVIGGCFYDDSSGYGYLMIINKWENVYDFNISDLERSLLGKINKFTRFAPDTSLGMTSALMSEVGFTKSAIDPINGKYHLPPFSMAVIEFSSDDYLLDLEAFGEGFPLLYPNPSKGTITLDPLDSYISWHIFNKAGKQVKNGRIVKGQKTIEVGNHKGPLLLVLKTGGGEGSKIFKIIIQ